MYCQMKPGWGKPLMSRHLGNWGSTAQLLMLYQILCWCCRKVLGECQLGHGMHVCSLDWRHHCILCHQGYEVTERPVCWQLHLRSLGAGH